MKIKAPKGLFDILPYGSIEPWKQTHLWHYFENKVRELCHTYGYQELRFPIFEQVDLFQRGVGPTSDIVTKEMYLFKDKAGRELALRPEGTSSLIRAFLENHLYETGKVHKFFYMGPMFRYERPQAGRYRQHHQFGVEALGVSSPEQDAEAIDLLYQLYRKLGLKNIELQINSVGDVESREAFKKAFKEYLTPHLDKLSPDSKVRFEKNPLRILDSKDPQDKVLLQGAPSILSHLTPQSKEHFSALLRLLDGLHIPYTINEKIVRGLDYYQKTVFEFISNQLGSQNAVGGGGRYDGFISLLGGPNLPGIGFGVGIERVLMTMLQEKIDIPEPLAPFSYFIPLGKEGEQALFLPALEARHRNIPVEIDLNVKKIHTALSQASKVGAKYAIIAGEKEVQEGYVTWKNLDTGDETKNPLDNLTDDLNRKWKEHENN